MIDSGGLFSYIAYFYQTSPGLPFTRSSATDRSAQPAHRSHRRTGARHRREPAWWRPRPPLSPCRAQGVRRREGMLCWGSSNIRQQV